MAGSLAAVVLVGVGGAAGAATFLGTEQVGRQPDGSVVTSSNQKITPAGKQLEFPGRPSTVRVRPDGKTAAVLNTGGAMLVVTDLATGSIIQQYAPGGSGSFDGLVYSPDGNDLYASRSNGTIVHATVAADGTLSNATSIALPSGNGNPYPGGLAVSADGSTLYATLSRANALAVIDLATGGVSTVPVGNAPHDVVVAGGKAYVSNQGGRPAASGDVTNNSSGTPIVADPTTGGAATGTVSVVDLAARQTVKSLRVGLQPTGMHLTGHDLFVANSLSDTVSVVDTRTDQVASSIDVRPMPGAPLGSQPNAVTMLGDRLVVSLGRNNALAVYDWQGETEPTKFLGLLPTGWYPGSVAADPARNQLVVANTKGVGALGAPGADGGHRVQARIGSVSLIPVPTSEKELQTDTEQVLANNGLDQPGQSQGTGGRNQNGDAAASPIPARIGDPSPIKHVFYIIKENRTYDQVLGDDARGNGDPALTTFGAQVTPNLHQLVQRFPLMDNFYASGDLSADGHQWDMQANVPDYLEKAFGGFVRSYPYNGGDALAYEKTGFLWGNAIRHDKSVVDFGEYAPRFDGPRDKFGTWNDWYHDYLKLSGQESGDPHVPVGTFQTHADVPQLDGLLAREYPNFDMNIPDQYRQVLFHSRFQDWVRNDTLPDLVLMHLPDDHTAGSATNEPTPAAMVADNDLALGKIVDEISHSKYWKSSAIFVTEDDSQAGTDHVDGHRTTGYVISPYAQAGLVDSHYWTQTNMVRTIEQILGLPPMNQMDLAATPMRELFTDSPDFTPYDARPNLIPLDTMNGSPAALAPSTLAASTPTTASSVTVTEAQRDELRQAWQAASDRMGFDSHDGAPDQVDQNLLNHAIWYASTGYSLPYPGEKQMLTPHQVPRDPATAVEAEDAGR